MAHSLNDLAVPATIGFATLCLVLTSLLQKPQPEPAKKKQDQETRPFGMAGSECRTLTDHSFEIFKDFGPDKVPIQFKSLLLSEADAERLLKQNAKSIKVQRKGNAVAQYDTGFVSVNAVNEDRLATTLLQGDLESLGREDERGFWQRWAEVRNALWVDPKTKQEIQDGEGDNDILLLSVIDGHGGGPGVADLTSRALHACLAKGLAAEEGKRDISKVLNDVFVALQADIIRMPLTMVKDHLADPELPKILPHPAPSLMSLWELVDQGACVSTALVDMKTRKLHVANLGDCRVVGGWFDCKTGKWRCEVMSELGDACSANPVEGDILRRAHPEDPEVVICDAGRGMRILGAGLPTRSMGDSGHQLPEAVCEELATVFDGEVWKYFVPRISPPYMITTPDIISRDLQNASGEQLRFVILASDGLWDKLSSEEACLLAAAYYDRPLQDPIAKTQLTKAYPLAAPPEGVRRPYPAEPFPGTMGVYAEGQWVFQGDDNAATHLLRNAMGRGDDWERQRMLSLVGPMARSYRDDTTVIVVKFDEDGVAQSHSA